MLILCCRVEQQYDVVGRAFLEGVLASSPALLERFVLRWGNIPSLIRKMDEDFVCIVHCSGTNYYARIHSSI